MAIQKDELKCNLVSDLGVMLIDPKAKAHSCDEYKNYYWKHDVTSLDLSRTDFVIPCDHSHVLNIVLVRFGSYHRFRTKRVVANNTFSDFR